MEEIDPVESEKLKGNSPEENSGAPKEEGSDFSQTLSSAAESLVGKKSKPASEEGSDQEQEEEKKRDPIEVLKEEAEDFKDKYWRLLAETENSRRRMQKERQELTSYAIQNVISEFLNPLDTFENAMKGGENAPEEVKNWLKGFEMILAQFQNVLSSHGIESFTSLGKTFDPHLHEAVEIEETNDHPDGTILQEFVKGYKMGDRTIRPARVKVAKEEKQKEQSSSRNLEEPEIALKLQLEKEEEEEKATNHQES